jgi:hypothetical protein
MTRPDDESRTSEELLDELVSYQEDRVRALGKRIVPHLTYDELYAPDDVPALAADRDYMHENGILAGLMMARTALRALRKRHSEPDGESA